MKVGRSQIMVGVALAALIAAGAVIYSSAGSSSSNPNAGSKRSTSTVDGRGTTKPKAKKDKAGKNAACQATGGAPARYTSVVVFSFENRSWSDVGDAFAHLPYLHKLARHCSYFADWTETDTAQSSATQYVGQITGARQPGVVDDCSPSSTCSTTADNIFRQARAAHLRAIDYVEGASAPCSASGNAAKHVPPLYLWSSQDRAQCNAQVRPYSEFRADALPNFAFVTPTLCNDGHDCSNKSVNQWAKANIQPVITSAAYRAGKVAVFVWYDEDHPVPNLWIAPSAVPGPQTLSGAGFAGTLAAWESMLGLPCLADACHAPDMRAAAHM